MVEGLHGLGRGASGVGLLGLCRFGVLVIRVVDQDAPSTFKEGYMVPN